MRPEASTVFQPEGMQADELEFLSFTFASDHVLEGALIAKDGRRFPIFYGVPSFLTGILQRDLSEFARRHDLPVQNTTAGPAAADQAKANETFSDKWRRFKNYGFENAPEEFLFDWYSKKFGPRREGQSIELVSVQEVLNEKVLELFGASHLIADQFIASLHGYTALEAMALARPVLCFVRNDDMMIDPATCPIINVRPEEVYDTLKKCLEGGVDLENLGKRGREYIDHYYSVKAVSTQLGRMYIETTGFSEAANRKLQSRVDQLDRRCSTSGHVAA